MPLLTAGPSKFLGGGRSPWYRAGGAPVPVAAYQPKGAASLAASYVNLANPGTYDAAAGPTPATLAANGWSFAGTNESVITTYTPTMPITVCIRFVPATFAGYRALVGHVGSGSGYYEILTYDVTGLPLLAKSNVINIGVATNPATVSVSNVVAVSYNGSGAWSWYKNGAADGSGTNAQTFGAAAMAFGVGRTITPLTPFSGTIAAIAIYSSVLTADQVAAVSAAMAAL